MSYQTPCSNPENDPNDWFISRDGKQYPDDQILAWTIDLVLNSDDRPDGEIIAEAEADALKDALRRRRHAKDKCYTECYFRTQCLDIALSGEHGHGTWGGYYEEELRELRREIARRRRVRRA